MTPIESYVADLHTRLPAAADWGEALQAIVSLADDLPPLDSTLKTEETRFHKCQSQIWLVLDDDPKTGVVRIAADSDARIMRGLLALTVGLYGNRTLKEISEHPPSVLLDSEIIQTLAPSRVNGFRHLLGHIYNFAVERRSWGDVG